MPGGGTHLRPIHALKQELQPELNQPRIVQAELVDNSETWRYSLEQQAVFGGAKLDAIESVEELRPELQAELVRPDQSSSS